MNTDSGSPERAKNDQLKIVGHRGARGLAPENTLAAIRKALEHHVDEIEIDVRITKDGKVVLTHDKHCTDAGGGKLMVSQHAYSQLKQHKPDLTTLSEAISAINRQVPLQIEVKWNEPSAPIIAVIQQFVAKGWEPTDFLIGSKKQQTLLEMHQALLNIPTVVIEPFSSIRAVWRARRLHTKRLSMRHHWLWSGFIRAMNRRGYQLYAYTLNDPAEARRWHSYGLAGVITDNPEAFEPHHHGDS